LEALEQFKRKLEDASATAVEDDDATAKENSNTSDGKENFVDKETNDNPDEEAVCDLHFVTNCLSCTPHLPSLGNPPSPPNDTTWLTHTLTFAKDRLGKDLDWKRRNEELAVEDPWEGSAGGGGGREGRGDGGKWKKDGGGRGRDGKGRDEGRAWDRR
jgi:peptidyl-prolyl cis-trans isomerase SDCCAG10